MTPEPIPAPPPQPKKEEPKPKSKPKISLHNPRESRKPATTINEKLSVTLWFVKMVGGIEEARRYVSAVEAVEREINK